MSSYSHCNRRLLLLQVFLSLCFLYSQALLLQVDLFTRASVHKGLLRFVFRCPQCVVHNRDL